LWAKRIFQTKFNWNSIIKIPTSIPSRQLRKSIYPALIETPKQQETFTTSKSYIVGTICYDNAWVSYGDVQAKPNPKGYFQGFTTCSSDPAN